MLYCGLDLGRRSSRYCIVDEARNVVREGNVRTHKTHLQRALGQREPMRIVLEATTECFWVADQLAELGHDARVVDPNQTKAIGASLIKHDKLDARVLAQLAAADLLAEVRIPTLQQRLDRMPLTARDVLVRSRTRIVNCIRSMLASEGFVLPQASPKRLVALLDASPPPDIPPALYDALLPLLEALRGLETNIEASTEPVYQQAKTDPVLQRLQTVPGVGPITASLFVSAIGDPHRFSSGRAVGAYLGLVPRLYQSGSTQRRGRITKHGNAQARWALTLAANSLLLSKSDSPLQRWARALAERIGRKKACCAIARKLASVLWSMWKNEQSFRASAAN
jgi:transposase